MAAPIAVKPIVLRDIIVSLDGKRFERAVSSAAFTPSASTVTWQGGTPDSTFTDVSPATWTCGLTFAQDWVTPGSLALYLHANEGKTVPGIFAPQNGIGPTFTADIVITAGAIGGAIGAVPEGTVTLGCQGKPQIVPAPAA
ncbi:hypothetical protein [Herbiconiux flava]|uniref:Uncharacterized protein n=1 Tax=Herbiconiux flava TaxID=881268 RepID=A0A852SU95_9MICO|nr:hypothetical protein [Herbiconiux flava]NYD72295.1 hypothetical protein [Herbiconiux flava]GLK17742.1 hypothetical protein GCM10017602_22240 [Herbiconiux flava]